MFAVVGHDVETMSGGQGKVIVELEAVTAVIVGA